MLASSIYQQDGWFWLECSLFHFSQENCIHLDWKKTGDKSSIPNLKQFQMWRVKRQMLLPDKISLSDGDLGMVFVHFLVQRCTDPENNFRSPLQGVKLVFVSNYGYSAILYWRSSVWLNVAFWIRWFFLCSITDLMDGCSHPSLQHAFTTFMG